LCLNICQILRLKCTKFDFGTPLGELTALPRPVAGFKGPTSKGEERRGRGEKRERKGERGGEGRGREGGEEGKGREGKGKGKERREVTPQMFTWIDAFA